MSCEHFVQKTCLAPQILAKDDNADSEITIRSSASSEMRTLDRAATMLLGILSNTSEKWRNEQIQLRSL